MEFAAYDQLAGRSNVIVDGYGTEGTVLVLSHWPGSGTPEALKDDLSTTTVFRYLDRPELHVEAEAISNNHFDEDGLCGIFAVLRPAEALARRDLVADVASTGDFGVSRIREGFRIAMAIQAYADPGRSPLSIFDMPYPDQTAALYAELLERLPDMLDHPDSYKELWEAEDARLDRTVAAVERGGIRIEEVPALDLAVVTVDDSFGENPSETGLYSATQMNRVLVSRGGLHELRYRYESWVEYRSRPVPARVDLGPLAEQLNASEAAGRWKAESVDNITPKLRLTGAESSAIPAERFRNAVERFLAGPA